MSELENVEEFSENFENLANEQEEIYYTCYMCGLKLKRNILLKKVQCLKCGSKIFYKQRDPKRVKKVLAR